MNHLKYNLDLDFDKVNEKKLTEIKDFSKRKPIDLLKNHSFNS